MVLYHHTSLAHLPWILLQRELVGTPAKEVSSHLDWPDDFVWVTTNADGDRTTAVCRQHDIPRIRITLKDDPFEDWALLAARTAGWSSVHIEALLNSAEKFNQSPVSWRAAVGPVGLEGNLIALASKTWETKWFEPDSLFDMISEIEPLAPGVLQFLHKGRLHKAGRKKMIDDLGIERHWYGIKEVEKFNA
jgi:hypothetical protein